MSMTLTDNSQIVHTAVLPLALTLSPHRCMIEFTNYLHCRMTHREVTTVIRKLFPYTKGYRHLIVLGVLCSAGEAVLELMLPLAMSDIVNFGIELGDRQYILATGLKMVVMAMLALACGVGAAALAARAGMGFGANLRQAEYEKVQQFSFSNIEHFSTASLITRLTSDVASVQMTLMMGMRMFAKI